MTAEKSVELSGELYHRLDQLKEMRGKRSIAEVLAEAVDLLGRFRMPGDSAAFGRLSPRLGEILCLIAEGRTNRQIAAQLRISVKTVEYHRGRLMKELGLSGISDLVRFAIRVGAILP